MSLWLCGALGFAAGIVFTIVLEYVIVSKTFK